VRIPANEVERAIAIAAGEVGPKAPAAVLESVLAAVRHAAKLNDTPYFVSLLRGRKDNVGREVRVSTMTKTENGNEYVLCHIPYTEDQILRRRRARAKYREEREGKQTVLRAFPPTFFHEQWVRKDRLRFAS
jgi:hypothetical protein